MWNDILNNLRKAFIGRPLLLYCLCFALGIMLAGHGTFTLLPLLAVAALLIFAYLLLRRHTAAICLLLVAALCCGIIRAGAAEARLAVTLPAAEKIVLEGKVTESSWHTENSTVVRVHPLTVNNEPWSGADIYIYYNGARFDAGAHIYAEGYAADFAVPANQGSFDYGKWLQRQGVAARLSCYDAPPILIDEAPVFSVMAGLWNQRLDAQLDKLPTQQQALVRGIFLGDKSGLDYAARETLSLTGVMHAFAVSGLHVGYIAAAALWLCGNSYQNRWLRLLLTAVFLLLYLTLTGFSASICRAALMALVMVLATAVKEKNDLPTSLALAALLCLLWKPLWLFDAGFQLSFAAVSGLILLLPIFRRLIPADYFYRFPAAVYDGFVVCVAASFATMPLISYYFAVLPPVGWLVSPLFVVGAGAVVLLGFAAAFICLFATPAAMPLLAAAGAVAEDMYKLCLWALHLPYAYLLSGSPPLWQVVLSCLLLALIPLLVGRKVFGKRRIIAIVLLMLAFMLCFAPQTLGGELELTMLDVGQGDAMLIITPEGRTILLDGGGNSYNGEADDDIGPYVLLPYLKSRGIDSIDIIISSHAHADHYSGLLAVLQHLPVGEFWYIPSAEAAQQPLLEQAAASGAATVALEAGMDWQDAEGLRWRVWAPTEITSGNAASLVLSLSYEAVDMLFTGDAEFEQLLELSAQLPPHEILKVPHHGSYSSYCTNFYAAVAAEAALISVGADNAYGHPADSVVEYWQSHGAEVYRTDINGQISLFTDGQSWRITTYK